MFLHLHDIAILEASAPCFTTETHSALRTEELTLIHAQAVIQSYASLGRRIGEERVTRRFANGLKFYRMWQGDMLAATSWIVSSGHRYIDELNWLIPVPSGEIWLRDIFVAPGLRGKGMFAQSLKSIVQQQDGPCIRLRSDVDWSNIVSMRAHFKAGFRIKARARALDLNGRLRLRSKVVPWLPPIEQITPQQQVIWLRGESLTRHRQLIA